MKNSKVEISAISIIKTILISGGILALLYIGKDIIMPLLVAAIIAILLDIPVQKLKARRFPNWLSVTLSILLLLIIFFIIFWFLSSQISNMSEDWPTLKEKATEKMNSISQWINQTLSSDYKDYIDNNKNIINRIEGIAGTFLSSLTSLFSQSLIVFVYIILFLIHRQHFIRFFKKLFSNKNAASSLLKNAVKIIRSYFVGKGKVMLFLFVIYYLGFLMGSVPYAMFLASFAALFSIIPYLGNIIGGGIAVLLSYFYAGETSALIVIGVVSATQLIENYILTPWIIGDEINLNPFFTVFGIILFSSFWGIVGAIISLPIIGVLMVVFEHTEGMEALAFLLKKEK